MDCQFIMGVFTSMYFHSFVGKTGVSVGTVLEFALVNLEVGKLVELYGRLGEYLDGQGVL